MLDDSQLLMRRLGQIRLFVLGRISFLSHKRVNKTRDGNTIAILLSIRNVKLF